jgi:ribulose-phosphate 3-epimerase
MQANLSLDYSHFVPNLTMGAPIISCLRKHTEAFFGNVFEQIEVNAMRMHIIKGFLFIFTLGDTDCHMMVAKPEQWVDDIAKAGGQMYTFHIEATHEPVKLIKQIHAAGMKAGVAIKPKTPADSVIGEIAELADMVLVMTVEPGFGGQRFMAECMPKVNSAKRGP